MEIDSRMTADEFSNRASVALMNAAEQYVIALWSECACNMTRRAEGGVVSGNPVEMIRCTWTLCGFVASALRASGEDVGKVDKKDPAFIRKVFDYVIGVIDSRELRQFDVHAECWLARRPGATEYRIFFLLDNHKPANGIERL